jgi:hypothetical protein
LFRHPQPVVQTPFSRRLYQTTARASGRASRSHPRGRLFAAFVGRVPRHIARAEVRKKTWLYSRIVFILILVTPPPPGGFLGTVRTAISFGRTRVWARFRPESGGFIYFEFLIWASSGAELLTCHAGWSTPLGMVTADDPSRALTVLSKGPVGS